MPASVRARRASPAGNYFEIPVEDLSGGLDLKKAPTLLKPNRARVLRNWSLREPGALSVFPGWRSFSTASLGSSRPQGGQRIYLGSKTPFTLSAWNGSVYKPTDAGVWGSAVSTGWNATNEVFFPNDHDIVAILDGATAGKKSTDGSTWTTFGIAAPAGAPTGAGVAGGTLTSASNYEFSYSGRDDELTVESNESPRVTASPGGANGTIRLTLTKHPDAQVDTLVVYGRDVTAGEAVRRKVGTVANPAGATTTFDVTGNTWGSGTEAPSDHDVPPLLSFAAVWKNRWWGRHATIKNRICFTQIFEPQSWVGDFTIDLPFEHGDDIAAILPLGDTLLIFGQTSIFLIIGQTSLDFEVRPSGASQSGALGPRAVDLLEQGAVHASSDGIYLFDGASDRLLSDDVDGYTPTAVGWRTYVTQASATDLARTPVCYHTATKVLSIGSTVLYPFGTPGEWILDLNRTRLQDVPAWTTTDRPIGGYVQWNGNEPTAGNRGRLFSWSQTIGKLYEERTGTTADGSDQVATYTGPTFAMGGRIASMVDGAVEFEPHAGTFGIEIKVDGTSYGSQNIDISGRMTSTYDVSTYDSTAVYDRAGRVRKPIVFPLDAEGLTAEITATYTGQESFRWFVYVLGAIPEALGSGF
jgi:hypothetical protein